MGLHARGLHGIVWGPTAPSCERAACGIGKSTSRNYVRSHLRFGEQQSMQQKCTCQALQPQQRDRNAQFEAADDPKTGTPSDTVLSVQTTPVVRKAQHRQELHSKITGLRGRPFNAAFLAAATDIEASKVGLSTLCTLVAECRVGQQEAGSPICCASCQSSNALPSLSTHLLGIGNEPIKERAQAYIWCQ